MSDALRFLLSHEPAFQDRYRLASLYSDFLQQLDTNPDGFYANTAAWRRALAETARAGLGSEHQLVVRVQDMERQLVHPVHGRPTGLGLAVGDGVSKKDMLPLKDFLTAQSSIYNKGWSVSPFSVMRWALRQVGVLGENGPAVMSTGDVVVICNLDDAAELVIQQMESRSSVVDLVLSRKTFVEQFRHVLNPSSPLSETDINVLLTHLARDRRAIVYDAKAGVVKFKKPGAAASASMTHQDRTIAELRDLIATLNTQIEPLPHDIATLDKTARFAVSTKQVANAKNALKSKHQLEQVLAKRSDTIAQLEATFARIEQAVTDVEVVKAMDSSAKVLTSLHAQVGGAEGVAEVVDKLSDEMAKHDDISALISEGRPVDEAEIDAEFEAMQRAERDRVEEQKTEKVRQELASLDVPSKEKAADDQKIAVNASKLKPETGEQQPAVETEGENKSGNEVGNHEPKTDDKAVEEEGEEEGVEEEEEEEEAEAVAVPA